MSLGVREACRATGRQFIPAGAFDLNPTALDVYNRNFGIKAQPSDLGSLLSRAFGRKATKAEKVFLKTLGRVDLAIAGPPCQGHSNLNNITRRDDPKNELYFRVARFARLFEPEHLIIENVPTVVVDKKRVVQRTAEALTGLGYTVRSGLVSAVEFGVPQTRRRHFLVASRRSIPELSELLAPHAVAPRSVWWAVGDLEHRRQKGLDAPCKPKEITRERIDYLFDRNLFDLPDSQRPDCHRLKDHTYKVVYGRMHSSFPSPTITGGFDTMGRGRFVHPTQRRTITPHEAARIQTIPDFFDFSTVEKRSRLVEIIGNAVPPKLSFVMALELLR